jgi:hypothetical protein
MNSTIREYKHVVPDTLCTEIIEMLAENNKLIIPKNDDKWARIERFVYKTLLEKINEYKTNVITNISDPDNGKLLELMSDDLYVKQITIQHFIFNNADKSYIRDNDRYNVIHFLVYLNDCDNGVLNFIYKNVSVQPKKGTLIFFPDNVDFKYIIPINDHYVINGQFVTKIT